MPGIKTALTTALKSANAPIQPKTQSEQIWLWIKDHPEITAKRLRADLKHIPKANISSLLAVLLRRKMLECKLVLVKPTPKFGKAETQAYSVPAGMKEYELLPLQTPAKPRAAPVQPSVQTPIQAALASIPGPKPEPTPVVQKQQSPNVEHIDVEQLPVHEALRLYRRLRELFGDLQ